MPELTGEFGTLLTFQLWLVLERQKRSRFWKMAGNSLGYWLEIGKLENSENQPVALASRPSSIKPFNYFDILALLSTEILGSVLVGLVRCF